MNAPPSMLSVPFIPSIQIAELVCGYGTTPVIRGVSLDVPRGEFLGILGPNGSGKTTLLRAVTRLLPARSGRVAIHGDNVVSLTRREIAGRVACVMQDNTALAAPDLPFTVRDIVTMGRTPYLARTGWETPADHEAIDHALQLAELAPLADRRITELSGGERQRAFIAMALAQRCDIILLDEPTNHLDIAHQVAILDLFAAINRDSRNTTIGVFHDLNLAAEYCDRILLLKDGLIAALGKPEDVLTAETIHAIYGANVLVQPHPTTGRPHVFLKR